MEFAVESQECDDLRRNVSIAIRGILRSGRLAVSDAVFHLLMDLLKRCTVKILEEPPVLNKTISKRLKINLPMSLVTSAYYFFFLVKDEEVTVSVEAEP